MPPFLGKVTGIGAGNYHSLVLQAAGTVAAWGDNSEGQCAVPADLTNVVAVAGGGGHSLALKADGTLIAWGLDWDHQCELATNLSDVVGFGAGEYHTLALVTGNQPGSQLFSPAWEKNQFNALAQTFYRKNYTLECKVSLTAAWRALSTNAGNGALKLLSDPRATNACRFYRISRW